VLGAGGLPWSVVQLGARAIDLHVQVLAACLDELAGT
jgi:hypothetical protein